jgi:predicted DCC family thiol-disulfide oxidoreductase YuxK
MRSAGRPVLVFDGDCGFCTSSARWAQRRLHLVHVEPWQLLDLDALGLTAERCDAAVQWVATDGTVESGARAAVSALRHGGGAWGVLGRLIGLPGVVRIADLVYRWIARHRHRLPGGSAACELSH